MSGIHANDAELSTLRKECSEKRVYVAPTRIPCAEAFPVAFLEAAIRLVDRHPIQDVGLARRSIEMLQRETVAAGALQPASNLASIIQFYSIELSPTADGRLYVGVTATVCEREGELECMEMGSGRVDSLDKALLLIREACASHH